METVALKQTDLKVSRICFGTMTFGAQVDEPGAIKLVDKALDLGVNFLDTANVYNAGASETILGKALGARRKDVVLASKVRGKMPECEGLGRDAIMLSVEASLRRLNTDYLDLYYMHQPDYAVPIEESLEAMERLVKAGKVRYPASSNYCGWQVVEQLWIARTKGYTPAVVTQPMYNLLARGIEQEYLPMCKQYGVSTVVYNPIAGGLLTGKQPRTEPLAGTRFDKNQMYLDRYWHPAYFDAVDELQAAAKAAGRSLVSVALNWLLHHTQADCVILGASKLAHLEQNIAACGEGKLDEATLAAIDAVWTKLRGVTPKYNR
jgi:aryl-alcohol dehydrogenase-like predicted oxidoreductase